MRLAFVLRFATVIFLIAEFALIPKLALAKQNSQSQANFIHGTIVVVVSTKDGFVLAGDSRGSTGCTPIPGEFEKVFSIGKRSGIVVAGLIGSNAESQIRESIAEHLHIADDNAKTAAGRQPQASSAIWDFASGVRDELTLLDTTTRLDSPVAAASAVSINEKGVPEWITVIFTPVRLSHQPGREYWAIKVDHFVDPPNSKVVALGAGNAVVNRLLDLDGPVTNEPDSQQEILRRYYFLKSAGKLSELTMADGKALAPALVRSAISFAAANPGLCLGIGGDVQVLSVTPGGAEWVSSLDKSKLAPPPPPFVVRIADSDMFGALDGGQWLRGTVPADATLTFSGRADVLMVQPRFTGKCALVLEKGAEQAMPETADRLRRALGEHCDVYRQREHGRERVSAAGRIVEPARRNDVSRYPSMCNRDLERNAHEIASQLKNFVRSYIAAEDRTEEDERLAIRQSPNEGDAGVVRAKYELLRSDRGEQFDSDYVTNFIPKAVAVRHELIKRVPVPARVGYDAEHKGWTTFDMYHVADDLDVLANKLPNNACE